MQNSSSAGRHGMPVDLLGSDDVIGGSWHSSKSPAHNLDNGNGMTMQTNKGKAKEVLTPVQRSPRRVASAKALENVMRNSAPPSAARTISSPSAAETSSEATGEASTAHAPSSSSPSRVLPLTNAKLAASQRRVQSLSPLPKTHRNWILQHTSSAPPASADDESEGEVSFIDRAEMSHFRFQAAPDCATSILTRPAPTLPYDASYLPLSPNNIDQLGHVLIPPSLSGQSNAKGTGDMYKHGRGNAANKRMLPGQDLQEHIVSQTPGHRAVPWGLQTTLKEQESGGKRARTKMGTLKRTA